jgi:hypothetical protein
MDNKEQTENRTEEFLKVVDYLEAAVKNENEEVAYYCRQYLSVEFNLEPMSEEEDSSAADADTANANPNPPADQAAADQAQPADPNAQPAQPDANAAPQA